MHKFTGGSVVWVCWHRPCVRLHSAGIIWPHHGHVFYNMPLLLLLLLDVDPVSPFHPTQPDSRVSGLGLFAIKSLFFFFSFCVLSFKLFAVVN